jgi:N-acetylmuramoyl-L-alanine amidase
VESVLTRFSDTYIPIDSRALAARRNKAEMLISFHVNSAVNPLARGAECWISDGADVYRDESVRLADLILQRLEDCGLDRRGKASDGKEQGVYPDSRNRHKRLGVLRGFDRTGPGVLVELGFLTNSHDAKLLGSATSREVIGAGIAMAVCEYYGIKPRIDLYYA